MITKTIGTGGDYTDINSAIANLPVTSWSDDYYFNIINSHNNTTAHTTTKFKANGHTITFNLNGYTISSNKEILLDFNNTSDYNVLLTITNGKIFFYSTSLSSSYYIRIDFRGLNSIENIQERLILNNLFISNHTDTPSTNVRRLIELYNFKGAYSGYCKYKIHNIKMYFANTNGTCLKVFADQVGGSGSGGAGDYQVIENCSFYCTNAGGVNVKAFEQNQYSWANYPKYRNCVFYGGFSYPNGYPDTQFYNCAVSDTSLADGTYTYSTVSGTIQNLSNTNFISIDPTSEDFLKINSTSVLSETGTLSISSWNTSDLAGESRPNINGTVSIGCYEPTDLILDYDGDGDIDDIDIWLHSLSVEDRTHWLAHKTHTVVIENGLIKSWTITLGGFVPSVKRLHTIVVENGLVKSWTIDDPTTTIELTADLEISETQDLSANVYLKRFDTNTVVIENGLIKDWYNAIITELEGDNELSETYEL
jgi:hypothetical protein